MINVRVIIVGMLTIIATVPFYSARAEDDKSKDPPKERFHHKVADATILITAKIPCTEVVNGVEREVWYKVGSKSFVPKLKTVFGTGFLFWNDSDLKYIVTAKHVAEQIKGSGEFYCRDSNGTVHRISFQDMAKHDPLVKWHFHKTEDIAIHPCKGLGLKVRLMKIPRTTTIVRPELLASVYVLGYPYGLGKNIDTLSPIIATRIVRSWPTLVPNLSKTPDAKLIMLEKPLPKGYSGSLVVQYQDSGIGSLLSTPRNVAIGIVSGYYHNMKDPVGVSVACVVPIGSLFEILDSKEVLGYEKSKAK